MANNSYLPTGGVEPHTCALYAITAVLLLIAAILGVVLIAYAVKR